MSSKDASDRSIVLDRFANRGVEAFSRMHKRHASHLHPLRDLRVTAALPLKNSFGRSVVSNPFALQHSHLLIDAGLVAGVFFGRLNRRFGFEPSRGFSGPSAEFISVNRKTASDMPLFAPMNNPYLRRRRTTRLEGRVSSTRVLALK